MLRPFIALLLLTAPAPALAVDWRLVTADPEGGTASFVDLASIRPRDAKIRTASTLEVSLEADQEGIAGSMVEIRIDCDRHRMTIFRIVSYDADNRQIDDLHGTRPWVGPFPDGTNGALIVAYICSNGASDAQAESWGAEMPFDAARQAMRERAAEPAAAAPSGS